MKKTFLSIVLMGASLLGFAQEDKVLMTINGEPIMASEFLYIYEKNNQETSLEKKSMEEYLDLFINFKLKVTEAIAQGVDTTQEFKDELKGYRAQATPKYLQDNAAIDSLVLLSYNRMANIRKASHILRNIPLPPFTRGIFTHYTKFIRIFFPVSQNIFIFVEDITNLVN